MHDARSDEQKKEKEKEQGICDKCRKAKKQEDKNNRQASLSGTDDDAEGKQNE